MVTLNLLLLPVLSFLNAVVLPVCGQEHVTKFWSAVGEREPSLRSALDHAAVGATRKCNGRQTCITTESQRLRMRTSSRRTEARCPGVCVILTLLQTFQSLLGWKCGGCLDDDNALDDLASSAGQTDVNDGGPQEEPLVIPQPNITTEPKELNATTGDALSCDIKHLCNTTDGIEGFRIRTTIGPTENQCHDMCAYPSFVQLLLSSFDWKCGGCTDDENTLDDHVGSSNHSGVGDEMEKPHNETPVLPKPDPTTAVANHSKPIQIFVMLGQSNMVGFGRVQNPDLQGTLEYITQVEGKYLHLVNDGNHTSKWTVRKDVVVVRKNSLGLDESDFLTVGGHFFGPELQLGHVLGHMLDEPVLLLKSGVGNRALGWDFLPPGSSQFEFEGKAYAGHGECPESWSASASRGESEQCGCILGREDCTVWWPSKSMCTQDNCWCISGSKCPKWYAGMQYDKDLQSVREVLADIGPYFPGYQGRGYKIAGFFFWQGFRDIWTKAHAATYERNLVRYIELLRQDLQEYGSEDAKFVVGTIGFDGCNLPKNKNAKQIFDAQVAVSGDVGKYPQHVGNVKTVNAQTFWRDTSVSPRSEYSHYNQNANSYLEIGTAMGWAYVDLVRNTTYLMEHSCQADENASA